MTARISTALGAILVVATAVFCSPVVQAGYDSNVNGKVIRIMTYSNGRILFRLNSQPASHPLCDPTYFAIHESNPSDARSQMLASLLVAKNTEEATTIGYEGNGDCAGGFIRVYRVG